jgi:hypothetical protein
MYDWNICREVRPLAAHMSDEIRLLSDRLAIVSPRGTEYGIRWSDVYRVHAYRIDGIAATHRVVCFDFNNGEFIELNDSMPGFDDMLLHVKDHLSLPSDYKEQVNETRCHETPVTLYRRA